MTLPFDLLKIPRRLSAVDVFGIAMIILSGTVILFPSFLEFHHELIPLVLGISFLLVGHSREEPIRIAYLWLFLLTMRIYLHSDERYLSWEIVLSDYIMIVVAFAASFRMAIRFWSWFFTLYAYRDALCWINLSSLLSSSVSPTDPSTPEIFPLIKLLFSLAVVSLLQAVFFGVKYFLPAHKKGKLRSSFLGLSLLSSVLFSFSVPNRGLPSDCHG